MADVEETRERILQATYACVASEGLDGITLEAAAREAGVARATVYRYFPGGREELLAATTSWAVGQFFADLTRDAEGAAGFADWMERILASAGWRMEQHQVLHDVLQQDAGQVVPSLAKVIPIVIGMLREEVARRLAAEELRPGVDIGQASDILARMMVSFMGTPGSWRVDDADDVRRLVREHLLAGVLASTE